jgi:hypothetical protein
VDEQHAQVEPNIATAHPREDHRRDETLLVGVTGRNELPQ